LAEKKPKVGGQAVIEGVMMRGPKLVATAVRQPDGNIAVDVDTVNSLQDRYPILKKPFLRGVVVLYESLVMGIRAISYSAKMAGEEDEQLTDKEMYMTIAVAFLLAGVLFVAIPTGSAKLFDGFTSDPVCLNLLEGGVRLIVFLAYIFAISRMKDIRRVFQYHGAEHKTIFCYEAGLPLTVENAQKFERLHPRCGTAFLLVVMLVSIFVFAFLGWPELWLRILSRLILLPAVAGISYEFIRLAADSSNALIHAAILPGLWLQYLTTRPPEDDMLEVAIESLKAVLPPEEILPGAGEYLRGEGLAVQIAGGDGEVPRA